MYAIWYKPKNHRSWVAKDEFWKAYPSEVKPHYYDTMAKADWAINDHFSSDYQYQVLPSGVNPNEPGIIIGI